jgi:hypothetical protein
MHVAMETDAQGRRDGEFRVDRVGKIILFLVIEESQAQGG